MSSSPLLRTVLLLIGALLISPALSLKCTSQTFSTKIHYENCKDLPALNAFLHWSYNQTKSTLSVAFVAPPAADDGWIAWGINPTATGMIGTQAFIAFKDSQGKIGVKTFNLSSYGKITHQKLSMNVLDSKAEASDGVMRIFATVELPKNAAAPLNQVWQVGAIVKDGVPQKHEFNPDNLSARATLVLPAGNSTADAPVSSPAAAPGGDTKNNATAPASGGQSAGNDTGGSSGNWKIKSNLYALLISVVGVFGLLVL